MGWKEDQKKQADSMECGHYVSDEGVPGIKMRDRKCTDPAICCLFIIWIIMMWAISIYAFVNGDINNLALKFDMDRVNCTSEYPKKLFTRLDPTKFKFSEMANADLSGVNISTSGNMYYSVCVKKCPMKNENVEYLKNSFYDPNTTKNYSLEAKEMIKLMEETPHEELTPWKQYDTQDLMGFCIFS